jgi:hypothetical protein
MLDDYSQIGRKRDQAVLGWFATQKVDHPLAEAKQSRRVVDDLPKDTHKALTEILFWLDSVNSTEGFRLDRRLELIEEFDQAAKLPIRKLAQDYLQLRQQKFQEHRVWTTQAEFWRLLAAGYLHCIEGFQADAPGAGAIKARLAVIVCRALAAFSQQLKWLLLRYGPVAPTVWESLGRLYAFAEARQLADKPVPLAEGAAASTCARTEFLKAIMLGAASTESLLPQQIEIVERSIALFASHFQLEQNESERSTYLFDLVMRKPPLRVHGATAERGSSMRYFGPGAAYEEMRRLLDVLLAEGVLPSDKNLGGEYESSAIADVWRHLLQYWSPQPPERGSERHAVNARLTIVHGFQPLAELLAAPMNDTMEMSLSALRSIESWVVENASDGGFGAVVPATGSDWLQVGAMIGLKVQGEQHWGVGVIRRMLRDGEQNRRVGIQRLSKHIVLLRIAPHGAVIAGNAVRENDPALLLTSKPDAQQRVRIMQASGTYSPGQPLVMRVHGRTFEVQPEALVESTDEYDAGSFLLVRKLS